MKSNRMSSGRLAFLAPGSAANGPLAREKSVQLAEGDQGADVAEPRLSDQANVLAETSP